MDSVVKDPNVFWHQGYVTRADRNARYGHKSGLVWFTGLPSSGKSSIAHGVEKVLFERGVKCYVLDGDNIRHGLNADLRFSLEDRRENIRRVVEVAKLMTDAGLIVLAAFVSPYREDRQYVRRRFEGDNFIEIYVKCSPEECERRDPKGNYRKARAGLIKGYTGVDAPYEEPEHPDLVLDTEKVNLELAISEVIQYLEKLGWI
ncbi:adenylyl-sulfate kinase [Thermosulfurimonas dismutans]|uniref:Adenylyl-sulfate kinase n=1 Tax=Thermosulfurimonas dismutans TaxID=999894 RepID=A0A179D1A4_9BACT|nr:adenylyl-sulfate kinase [Thermosulfurimonas dismutans]OAQ19837.1 Adenylylsulfate kinase [Thermosulfurimonas dismutans]